MILVNNPGSWGHIYAPLEHASWNGLTPTDLVFPFFMYIMGISTYFSLRKFDFAWSWPTVKKIIRRTVVIFAIGLAIAWLAKFLKGICNGATLLESVATFDTIRILGVMPRLAICYCAASLIAIMLKNKHIPLFIAGLLVIYAIILLTGDGFEFADSNVISIVDHKVLGAVELKFDPEGLLSTLPSIAHVLIGFWCGMIFTSTKDNNLRINKLFIIGTILTFSGFLLNFGLPINKKVWSPTFVLTTCGLASSFLGLLIWIIDIKGKKKWCRFFEAFGINPLFMYVLGGVVSLIISFVHTPDGTMSIKGWIYNDLLTPLCGGDMTLSSLLFALLFVAFIWCFGYILYKKKIYIKI
jgi:predicted acyltransferase